MRNYILPVFIFVLIFLAFLFIISPKETSEKPIFPDEKIATPSATLTPSPIATPTPIIIRTAPVVQPNPMPIIIKETTEKETVREVPVQPSPAPNPTPVPQPTPTQQPAPTPRVTCVLGICI